MSEQLKPGEVSQDTDFDDDPLAELARIVAGEPELEPAPSPIISPVEEPVMADNQQIDVNVNEALQVELEQQLAAEMETGVNDFNAAETDAIEIEAPAFVQDIREVVNEAKQAQPDETAQVPAEETGFHEGLINVLEQEVSEEVLSGPVASNVETLNPAVVAPPQQTHDISTIQAEITDEAVQQVNLEVTEIQEAIEKELQGVSLSEEAVASQFADTTAQMSGMAESVSEPGLETHGPDDVPADQDVEADFEAAFANELSNIKGPQGSGWSGTDTLQANADFVAAAASHNGEAAVPIEQDPGYVGIIENTGENDHVAAGVVQEKPGNMKYAVAALVIALFAGAIAAGYGFLGVDGKLQTEVAAALPAIIKADTEPVKVKPKDPGGKVVVNQDNASYESVEGGDTSKVSQETLVSQTEEPAVINTQVADLAQKSSDRLSAIADDIKPALDSLSSVDSAPSNNLSVQPKVVQTVVVKPDGTIITTPSAPKAIETATNTINIGSGAGIAVNTVTTETIKKPGSLDVFEQYINKDISTDPTLGLNVPKQNSTESLNTQIASIDGAISTGELSVPTLSPLPKPVQQVAVAVPAPKKAVPEPVIPVPAAPAPKKAKPAPASTAKSEWVVQVSSQRTPEAAQTSFRNMRNRFSALQGRPMSIQKANVNGTTYYRVRVQTSSRNDANQLCTNLASAGGSCFVTR